MHSRIRRDVAADAPLAVGTPEGPPSRGATERALLEEGGRRRKKKNIESTALFDFFTSREIFDTSPVFARSLALETQNRRPSLHRELAISPSPFQALELHQLPRLLSPRFACLRKKTEKAQGQ